MFMHQTAFIKMDLKRKNKKDSNARIVDALEKLLDMSSLGFFVCFICNTGQKCALQIWLEIKHNLINNC